mgnify:CR=1 FL=1
MSLDYINYKLPRLLANNVSNEEAIKEWLNRPFSPKFYSLRDIRYFKSEPLLVENYVLLKEGTGEDLKGYMNRMARLYTHVLDKSRI